MMFVFSNSIVVAPAAVVVVADAHVVDPFAVGEVVASKNKDFLSGFVAKRLMKSSH